MTGSTKRTVGEGIGFGILAGIVFAMMEMVGAAIMGNPPLMPFRMFASLAMGAEALETTAAATAFFVGAAVHLGLSAVYGLIYTSVSAQLTPQARTSWGRQAGIGLAFGVALWLVNFQVIARFWFPWFLDAPQLPQAMMHAVFFGLPLGLMCAGAERRALPSPAVARAARAA